MSTPVPISPPPGCEIDTIEELARTVTDLRTSDACLLAAHLRQNAIAAGIMVVRPDGRIVPNPNPIPEQLAEVRQSFHGWHELMRSMGYEIPRLLTRATYYRARLDDAVRYTRGSLRA